MKNEGKTNEHKPHTGEPVAVGNHTIYVGGVEGFGFGFDPETGFDVVIPLLLEWRPAEKRNYVLLDEFRMPDRSGLPANWHELLKDTLIPRLKNGEKVVTFCFASHGRTGALIASLIAILEPEVEDPIAEARKRHCHEAVESKAQAEGVFALKGKSLPRAYAKSFKF